MRIPLIRLTTAGITVAVAAGCVAPGKSTHNYTPPDGQEDVQNTRTVDMPFDATWDGLVSSLSGSFFVINNLSKDSGLINLSYSTSDPGDFVECGTTERTFAYRDESRRYEYGPSDGSSYKAATEVPTTRTIVTDIHRDTNLEGRINVYVEELSPEQTRVRVNTRYVLTAKISGVQRLYSPAGVLQNSQNVQLDAGTPITFNTNSTGRENWGTVDEPTYVECLATGALEARILDNR